MKFKFLNFKLKYNFQKKIILLKIEEISWGIYKIFA